MEILRIDGSSSCYQQTFRFFYILEMFRLQQFLMKDTEQEQTKNTLKFHTTHSFTSNLKPISTMESLEASRNNSQNLSQITQLVKVMSQFINITKEQNKAYNQKLFLDNNKVLQPRDRWVIIQLPDSSQRLSNESLQKFISQVCRKVLSITFNAFSNDEMSFQSAKVYASEQIIRNLVRLCQKYQIGQKEFKFINTTIKGKILDYLWYKYPLQLKPEINRNLNKTVKETDYTFKVQNDYIGLSDLTFKYRQNGQYNDLIMKSINEALRRTNKPYQRPVFQLFENTMSEIFQSVMDNEIMLQREIQTIQRKITDSNSIEEFDSFGKMSMPLKAPVNKKDTIQEKLKQNRDNATQLLSDKAKYRKKVQEYTQYKIGRKIPQSTSLFTQQEIAAHNIKIQNPQILRMLSKWCEQLQRKFQNISYLQNYIQVLRSKNQNILQIKQKEIKQVFIYFLKQQKAKIDKEMEQLYDNNYILQGELIRREFRTKQCQQIQKYQIIAAKSSIAIVNNLHSYTIQYLNRLIHGLLIVSAKFNKSFPQIQANVPVITFQIMDLFRCRCVSGDKQIISIYNEILRCCEVKRGMELVKVVNRLKRNTNDVLINIKYYNVLCQIQLSVNRKNNNFIQHSNVFNHYIYQLKRSIFGPITELCSIWKCLDNRFEIYSQIKNQPNFLNSISPHSKEHEEFQPYYKPFICNICSLHYYNNIFIKNHQKCKECFYWICAKCQIKRSNCLSILQAAFKKDVVEKCRKIEENEEIPQYGICVMIQWHTTKIQPFKKIVINGVQKIMGVKDKKIYRIVQLNGIKQRQNFKEKYLIFSIDKEYGHKRIKIDQQHINQFQLEQKLRKVCMKHNDKISMNRQKLNNKQLTSLCNIYSNSSRHKILRVDLAQNQLEHISTIAEMFPNTNALNVSQNNFKSFENLNRLAFLQTINLDLTNLERIPSQVYQLKKLKELSANKNAIETICPNISQLKQLKILSLSHNSLKDIPLEIGHLPLLNLNFSDNQLKFIPDNLCKTLNQLEILNMQNNNIGVVNPLILNMKSLKKLNLSHNQIEKYPEQLNHIDNIQEIDLSFNQVTEIPQSINNLKKLKEFNLSNNELNNEGGKKLPNIQSLIELAVFDLSNNKIEICPHFNQHSSQDDCSINLRRSRKLQVLSLAYNKLRQFTNVQSLIHLQQLRLNNNNLHMLDSSVGRLQNLLILRLDSNQLKELPHLSLKSLAKLSINRNKLQSFQSHNLKKLQDLDLSDNRIHYFSSYMPLLTKLNLSSNALDRIQLFDYTQLKVINISHNVLVSFPKFHQKCKPRTIILQNNSITELPPAVTNLSQLKHLNVAKNKITNIPSYLIKLRSLQSKSFELNGNPLKRIECWNFLIKKATATSLKQIQSNSKDIVVVDEEMVESLITKLNMNQSKQSSESEDKIHL